MPLFEDSQLDQSEAQHQDLGLVQRHGSALITFQPVKTYPNCWRMVFCGAKDLVGMTTDTVDEILDSMSRIAEDVFG